jgi:hypothetical protein
MVWVSELPVGILDLIVAILDDDAFVAKSFRRSSQKGTTIPALSILGIGVFFGVVVSSDRPEIQPHDTLWQGLKRSAEYQSRCLLGSFFLIWYFFSL